MVLWVNGTHAPVRMRFTLAHELGHVRCGHDAGIAVDTYETLAGRTTDSREVQANAFAAELLAPAAGVRAMIDGEPTLEDVVRIAARHGISAVAALYRLSTLRLTRRVDALRREIDEGLAAEVWRGSTHRRSTTSSGRSARATCPACRRRSRVARSRRSWPGARRSTTPRRPRAARPSGSRAPRRRSGSV